MNAPFKPTTEPATTFVRRHIGPSPSDVSAMLETVGARSLDELMAQTLPAPIRQRTPLDLGTPLSETEALAHMKTLASQNQVFTSLIGQGYSGTILPAVIQRNILENPAWYTAYTPYQPEISQGRLEALFNFQTMICDLCGLDVANASLLDEATAAAEAMALAERAEARNTANRSLSILKCIRRPSRCCAPVRSRWDGRCSWAIPRPISTAPRFSARCCNIRALQARCVDLRPAIAALHAKGALAIIAADLLALTLLASPGELGADIAIGSAQRFGVPMGYGGPHAAYMAVQRRVEAVAAGTHRRAIDRFPGQPAYRLALQTREQHIRREKATSNICTAQVLLAVIASMYAVYHGPEGLTQIARTVHRRDGGAGGGTAANSAFAPSPTVLRHDHGNRRRQAARRCRSARWPRRSPAPRPRLVAHRRCAG